MKKIEELEKLLHNIDQYNDKSIVKNIIHTDFIEIWYSWNTYWYDDTIKWLLKRKKSTERIHSQEYEFYELSSNIVQVIYKTVDVWKNTDQDRYAKRTSIWIQKSNNWQLKYHQATPIQQFTLIN